MQKPESKERWVAVLFLAAALILGQAELSIARSQIRQTLQSSEERLEAQEPEVQLKEVTLAISGMV